MNIFPIKACEDNQDEAFSEILGFQVLDSNGRILATGENEEEARNAALTALFLSESNPISKKVKLGHKLISKKTARIS
ncbi:MAG: hypothetical protein A3C50_03015 [Candidatus Staskawiczbacteria bacterium RIFCSPHIGHO2_02_FULL_43_16]|uniref:DRBM domain-containing protein n=1 Tax=Candidatus Staskawiczbacteria bacterium RIFCSPHIGHO2_01_FULL_41_41 TaxID=1802203 RepID=A0A1G2HRL2_9BACT|nr:MAG: hypothetical protein A2822_01080 [Candidatus Staskawiczbacteria bacterium RIFCSPHIGHO2_01_FULL_41_41]OGZ68586.1 MAG: hypothetical protein A3C50_03015 [Candidatus Staskawiczbacteria bacterium RIFCSPHIGHO2_02_FULL_43_16]